MQTNPVRGFSFRLTALTPVAILAAISSTAIADEFRVTIDEIIAQWELREQQSQNLHMEWSRTLDIPAESRLFIDELTGTSRQIPNKDISIPISYSLLLAGEMARYDFECDSWDEAYNGLTQRYWHEVYNGKYATRLTEMTATHAEQAYPIGSVENRSGLHNALRSVLPIILAWRSSLLDDLQFMKLESFRIVESSSSAQQRLVTISNRDTRYNQVYEIDVAVDQDLVPVALRSYSGDRLSSTTSITYSDGSDQVRFPEGWSWNCGGGAEELCDMPSRVVYCDHVTVTNCDLDPFISEDLFELQAPPNTKVNNEFTCENYILRADGSKRLITIAERDAGVTYQTLVDTESGMAASGVTATPQIPPPDSHAWSVSHYVFGLAIFCFVVFAFILVKTRL